MPVTVTAPPARKAAPKAPPAPKASARGKALQDYAPLVQGMALAFGQIADAGAIGVHFPGIAMEAGRLADDNARVARVIDPLIAMGPYTALLAAVIPLLLQVAVNHNRIPVEAVVGMGVVPPVVLELQMKTEIMRVQREAQEALAAMEELAKEQAMREAYNGNRHSAP